MNTLIAIVYWISVTIVVVWAVVILAIFIVWLTIFFMGDDDEGDEEKEIKHYREFD